MAERTLPELTEAELRVLRLVPYGLSDPQIAKRLGRKTDTVKTHLRRMNRKWGTNNRMQLVVTAYEHGVLTLRRDHDEQAAALDDYRTTVVEVARLLGISQRDNGLTREAITAELRKRLGLTDPRAGGVL